MLYAFIFVYFNQIFIKNLNQFKKNIYNIILCLTQK